MSKFDFEVTLKLIFQARSLKLKSDGAVALCIQDILLVLISKICPNSEMKGLIYGRP